MMNSRLCLTGAVVCVVAVLSLALVEGQNVQKGAAASTPAPLPADEQDIKLPSGKSQRDEILKQEREQNIKDAAQLAQLAEELKEDLEKNDRFVFSLTTLKKTDDIEKLAKKIRARMRHY
jgi:cell division septation protein DedD